MLPAASEGRRRVKLLWNVKGQKPQSVGQTLTAFQSHVTNNLSFASLAHEDLHFSLLLGFKACLQSLLV